MSSSDPSSKSGSTLPDILLSCRAAWFVFAVYNLLLLILSLLPGDELPQVFDLNDKLAHAIGYFFLTAISAHTFFRSRSDFLTAKPNLWAACWAANISAMTEFAQNFVPGRFTDVLDLAANTAGIAVSFGLLWLLRPDKEVLLPDSLTGKNRGNTLGLIAGSDAVSFPAAGTPMNYFDYQHRVIYGETDKMGISYYANYFLWFEAARNEYFRALGMPYTECEKKGYFLPVVETSARYIASSTYDDIVIVRTSVSQIRRSSMRFEYKVFKNDSEKPVATGFSIHAFVDSTMKPVRVPDEIRQLVTLFSLLQPPV